MAVWSDVSQGVLTPGLRARLALSPPGRSVSPGIH